FAAALRSARRDSGAPGRARTAARLDRRGGVRSRDGGAHRSPAEHSRVQAAAGAPGVKVTQKNFGRDRRYPITNRFRDMATALPEPDHSLVARASRGSADAFDG